MNKQEVEIFLQGKGYQQDTYGHFKKTLSDGKVIRYKMQKTSVRQEIKVGEGKDSFWFKKWGEYYCNIEINPDTQKLRRIK